jgi:hypothetical protein
MRKGYLMKREDDESSVIVSAAKKIGAAAGTIASLGRRGGKASHEGHGETGERAAHKHRLPRKQKKALKKSGSSEKSDTAGK